MKLKIGKFDSSIASLELNESVLDANTLIIAEKGSGKTNLANKIRTFVMNNNVPTLYLDFSNPKDSEVEARYRDSDGYLYMQFQETEAFDQLLANAIKNRENIYMAIDPKYFSDMRLQKSRLSEMIGSKELLDNYYYFFHEVSLLNTLYTKFDDFLLYMFDLVNLMKYGFTFLTQPHEIFETPEIKLLFTYLYLGKLTNKNYYNIPQLKNLEKNSFFYQCRSNNRSISFNTIKSDFVIIDEA